MTDTPPTSDEPDDLALVVLHHDSDSEYTWINHTHVDPSDGAEEYWTFAAQVPKRLVVLLDFYEKAERTARRAIFEHLKFDTESGNYEQPCDAWTGDLGSDGEPHWEIAYPPSGDPNVWPAGGREVRIGYSSESAADAQAQIDALPERFYVMNGSVRFGVELDRAKLIVTGPHQYPRFPSRCWRCGNEKSDHGDAKGDG